MNWWLLWVIHLPCDWRGDLWIITQPRLTLSSLQAWLLPSVLAMYWTLGERESFYWPLETQSVPPALLLPAHWIHSKHTTHGRSELHPVLLCTWCSRRLNHLPAVCRRTLLLLTLCQLYTTVEIEVRNLRLLSGRPHRQGVVPSACFSPVASLSRCFCLCFQFLPPHNPTEEEKKSPIRFANRVRQSMAE